MRTAMWMGLALIVLAAGCDSGPKAVPTNEAEALARKVLDAIAAGGGEQVYTANFTDGLRGRIAPETWSQMCQRYGTLGKVVGLEPVTISASSIEKGVEDASLQYAVAWINGTGTVTMNMVRRTGEAWKITNISFEADLPEPEDLGELPPASMPTTAPTEPA